MKSFAPGISMAFILCCAVSPLAMADEVPFKEPDLIVVPRPPQQGSGLFRIFGFGMYLASAGDAASTEWALSQPKIFERNPLMANRAVRLSAHALAPTVMWWSTEQLRRRGHGRSALLLRIGMTAGYSYLTLHNRRTALRH